MFGGIGQFGAAIARSVQHVDEPIVNGGRDLEQTQRREKAVELISFHRHEGIGHGGEQFTQAVDFGESQRFHFLRL